MAIRQLSRRVNQTVEWGLAGLGLVMVVVVAAQVFCRYVLNHSLFWSEELARYLLVWLTFLGATVAYHRRAHPSIDMLQARVAPSVARAMTIAGYLVALLFFGVLTIYGFQFAHFVRAQISPALQIPKWTVLVVLPLSGAILCLHTWALLLDAFRRGRPLDG
ncbi:MAG: TRAP transporter small permease [Desulfobacterales bacterium]|nr:TRAP transporter small permease [Desulfobacterales bacterium]